MDIPIRSTLEAIAELTDTDSEWAVRFCREVQRTCITPVSFDAIKQALDQLGCEDLSITSIAELASRIQGLGAENVLALKQPSLPSEPVTSTVDLIRNAPTIQAMHRHLAATIARCALDFAFAGSIEGKTIAFEGDGPFAQEHLRCLAAKLGAHVDEGHLPWWEIDWLVIGRHDFHEDEIANSFELGTLDYYSQEAFIGFLLFGRDHRVKAIEQPRHDSHAGMNFVGEWLERHGKLVSDESVSGEPGISITTSADVNGSLSTHPSSPDQPPIEDAPFAWPVITDADSVSELETTEGWQPESELRRLGYSVAQSVSLGRRRSCLILGVKTLGLPRVVNHLAWLIRFHRHNPRYESAVARWMEDLDWLRSVYEPTGR